MAAERVLIVSPRFPLPLQSGTQLRVYHSLRALADRFDVTLVALVQDGEGSEHVERIEQLGVDTHTVPHDRSKSAAIARFATSRDPYRVAKFDTESFRNVLDEVLATKTFDLVWVHFLTTLSSFRDELPTPLVLDQHNAAVEYWESFRRGNFSERVFARFNQRRLRRLQTAVAPAIDAIVSPSEADAESTRRWASCPVWVVPNGIDTEEFRPSTSASEVGSEVAFVGSLNVRMNVEALSWFVDSSWPRIREQCPEARFRIVGRSPNERVRELDEQPGVDVVGSVPDVRPHYDQAGVVVAPFAFGGGTKLKILEALAMERGLVTTPTGATGIELVDGEHALVRERRRFADAVTSLLADPVERSRLGSNGRKLVCGRYEWDTIMSSALDTITETVL